MILKEIRKKILRGDIAGLFRFSTKGDKVIQPAEVAQIFLNLPAPSAIKAFLSFPEKNRILLFPYLDHLVQKQIIPELSKEEASKILNSISSDDLMIFLSHVKGVELTETLEFLNEKNKKAAHNLLGYPVESVALLNNTEFGSLKKKIQNKEYMIHLGNKQHEDKTKQMVY